MDAVPMDSYFHAFHMIFYVDYDLVVLAHLNAGSRNHTICCENTTLYTISQHTLAMAPYCIGGVRCAHLTCSVNNKHIIYNARFGYLKYNYLYFETCHGIQYKVCIVVLIRKIVCYVTKHIFLRKFNFKQAEFASQKLFTYIGIWTTDSYFYTICILKAT